jgi:hypothetical protein
VGTGGGRGLAGGEKYLRGMARRRGWDCVSGCLLTHTVCTHTSREGTALCAVHSDGASFD